MKTQFALLASLGLLAACGGGTTGSTPFDATGPISVDNINAIGEELFDRVLLLEDSEVDVESLDDLQARGSASFSGLMVAGGDNSDESIIGRANLTATFTGGGSLTGSVTELAMVEFVDTEVEEVDEEGFVPLSSDTELTPIAGGLTLTGGKLSGNENAGSIAIDVEGSAVIPAALSATDLEEDYDIEGSMDAFLSEGYLFGSGEVTAESERVLTDLEVMIIAK